MSAMAATFGIYLFWLLLGRAALSVARRVPGPGDFLAAPAVGMVLVMAPLVWLNRFGFPIRALAWPTTAVLAIVAAGILWRQRPAWSWRDVLLFEGFFLVAILLIGSPMLRWGTDWLAY